MPLRLTIVPHLHAPPPCPAPAGKVVDALARMVHRSDSMHVGKALCAKLADALDRQQFEVILQVRGGV